MSPVRERPRASSAAPAYDPPSVGLLSRRKRAHTSSEQSRIVGDQYQLGAEIGKGGYGTVFAALDLHTGRSVAIKQIALHDVAQDELAGIESEINLLKKLKHDNIVKYYDTIKTEDYLHIVLEYMENGSLAQFMKKFGSLSETLVAMYISQVLAGLEYLHEQGVLHRDIKGANVLTTKDGLVKLADFGVAIKLNDTQKSMSVVGSPYWMAPEVIEMTGCNAAADVWSVGCTTIELLTGKPPYFDLAPMAALFRIVQDDHPPLPEEVSPALRDFLMKCFMKEPRLRLSAVELLNHPWISSIPENKVRQSERLVEESTASHDDRDIVLNTIKLYSKVTDVPEGDHGEIDRKVLGIHEEEDEEEDWDTEFEVESKPSAFELPTQLRAGVGSVSAAVVEGNPNNAIVQAQLRALKGCGSVSSMRVLEPRTEFQLSQEDKNALVEGFFWEDEDRRSSVSPKRRSYQSEMRSSTAQKAGIADKRSSQNDDSTTPDGSTTMRNSLKDRESGGDTRLREFREDDQEGFEDYESLVFESRETVEVDGERFNQPFAVVDGAEGDESNAFIDTDDEIDLASRLKQRLLVVNQPDDEFDAFEDNELEELDFEQPSARDLHVKVRTRVLELLGVLQPNMEDEVILSACEEIHTIFEANPSIRRQLMSYQGVISNIMDALEVKKTKVLSAVLKVVNQIVEDNNKFLENMALIGLIPVITRLASQNSFAHHSAQSGDLGPLTMLNPPTSERCDSLSTYEIRFQAAKIIRQSCKGSSLTLQMFIACGGLWVLVDLLGCFEELSSDTEHHRDLELVRISLDGIEGVFTLQTIPKNDFCRLFAKAGLLQKLVVVFNDMVDSFSAKSWPKTVGNGMNRWKEEELHQVCDILLLFSQGDVLVKEKMCDVLVLQGMLESLKPGKHGRFLDSFFSSAMVKILKCIRNLSMEPNTLDVLDRAGAIGTLTSLLSYDESPKFKDMQNCVLHTMFYLCRINRNRQTQAAQSGLIPFLQRVTSVHSPLKQFALPILCDLAHASHAAREQLWHNDGVSFFLGLLSDRYWQTDALSAVATWLSHDTEKVEGILLEPKNMLRIITLFRAAQQTEFETLLEPLLDIVTKSVRINKVLGCSGLFVAEIVDRLSYPKAIVRKQLLKMLKSLFDSHHNTKAFAMEYNLYPIVYDLSQDDNMILVMEMALQLLDALYAAVSNPFEDIDPAPMVSLKA